MDEAKGRRGGKKGKRQRCEEVRKTGLKGWKGTPWPDRRVRKVQRARSKPQTPWYATRKKDEEIGTWAKEGRRLCNVATREKAGRESGRSKMRDFGIQPWRRRRYGTGSWGGTEESAMRETERTRRGGRVGPSEKSRAVPRGSRERKGLSRGRDLHIPWGQWDGAMWRHGLSVLFWSRWPGLRSDYGAVALGRWDKRGSEGGSLV